jgi:hypothetical protein
MGKLHETENAGKAAAEFITKLSGTKNTKQLLAHE